MTKIDFETLVAVSTLPGVYKVAANRSNGLIIEDLDTGKKRFAPARKHNFTPLASIGIYSDTDTTELKIVFQNMLEKLESHPPVAPNAKPDVLHQYFAEVLPGYDRDRVFISDIKKVIKWFSFLNERNLIPTKEEEEARKKEEEAKAAAEEAAASTEENKDK